MLVGFALQGFSGGLRLLGNTVADEEISGLRFLLVISGLGLVWVALHSPWGALGAARPEDIQFELGRPGGLAFTVLLRTLGLIATGTLPAPP